LNVIFCSFIGVLKRGPKHNCMKNVARELYI
jgi:hypothetical protein